MEARAVTLATTLAADAEDYGRLVLGGRSFPSPEVHLWPADLRDHLMHRLGTTARHFQTLIPSSDARFDAKHSESVPLGRGNGNSQDLKELQHVEWPPHPWLSSSLWTEYWKALFEAWRTSGQAILCLLQRLRATLYTCNAENLWTTGLKEKGATCRTSWSPNSQIAPQARGFRKEVETYQIFVKTFAGKTLLLWVSALDTGETLKTLIEQREGYPGSAFYLLCEGKALKADDRMGECQIHKHSTIHVMSRLRGGSDRNRGSTGPASYKDAARPKGYKTSTFPPSTTVPLSSAQPRPYIVEKMDEIPSLEVKNPEVKNLFKTLQTHALICRFNGFWPRSYDLHNWIYTNWTIDCQILLCSKGFFTVQFEKQEDCQKVITQGPWFWGRAGLFLTPWFPEFDANSMVVTKMPVWVRLPNLPLPFWHHMVLEDIGNLLGSFIKRDPDRNEQGLFTYARICVEIDLSKGLPDRIHLQYEKFKWLQLLDYENTAFRCRFCHVTGHLQDTCPLAKRYPKKKKGTNTRGKTWQSEYAPHCSEDSEDEESELEEQQKKEERAENWQNPESMVERKTETKSDGKETPMEPVKDASLDGKSTGNSMADYNGEGSQTAIVTQEKELASGVKRGHESEKSDSDKEHPPKQIPEMVNGRQLVIATPSQGRWVEVKNKRKGKKGKIEAYYKP